MGKLLFVTPLLASSLFLFTQTSYADKADQKFTLAIIGDPQYKWTCSDEASIYKADETYIRTLSDYCNSVKDEKKIDQAKDSNQKALHAIEKLQKEIPLTFKGLIINGDLTSFGHSGERDFFQKLYKIRSNDLIIYPGLGNHDYKNNINRCGAIYTQGYNNCAGQMMHIMADWILGYKGLDKGHTPVICNDKIISCDIYAFNKNPWQSIFVGNRNVIGSLSYTWEIGDFRFIQLQNYPHYTTDFKRGWSSGSSSWTMRATNSMSWLNLQLEDAKTNNKHVVLNLHNIRYYYNEGVEKDDAIERERRALDKKQLEDTLQKYSSNIRAIFVGHLHQKIGIDTYLAGIPIIYSGSPIAGRYLKVDFDSTNLAKCITVTPLLTVDTTPVTPLNSSSLPCNPL